MRRSPRSEHADAVEAPRRAPGSGWRLAGIVAALICLVIVAPFVAHSPVDQRLAARLAPPSATHPMGLDHLGRDVLSRVLHGMRHSVLAGIAVAAVSGTVGGALGLLSGYRGGLVDLVAQRLVDTLMAVPLVVLALAVIAAAGASTAGVLLALSVAFVPLTARVARASAMSLRQRLYVDAARSMGMRDSAVILRHVLPNAAGPLLIVAATQMSGAVLAEASLGFLGFGAIEPRPSLGGMLGSHAQTHMYQAPWLVVWPGVALALVVLVVNLAADRAADSLARIRP